jgi:ferritin-like metal-binding protein YciE
MAAGCWARGTSLAAALFMPIASLKDLYFDELGDLYDAETQILRHLPRLAELAHAPELREALLKHCDESRLHVERLELIFTHWSERRRGRPCAAVAGIVQEADDRLAQVTLDDARDAAIIGVAQRIEHYEIAAYGCARTYARRLNRADEARLLDETLQDEGRADHRLTEIAEAHINDDARGELEPQGPAPSTLRFVRADDRRTLAVRHGANEDLGRFTGVLVEASNRPRYIVVDGGGLFSHRRYLLPIEDVRYDDASNVLRVDVAKDIAERYPSFDPDAFRAMSDDERLAFGAGLLERFPSAAPAGGSDAFSEDAPPEWLVAATWITVPPSRAERLADPVRAFANEFDPKPTSLGERPDSERMVAKGEDS